MSLPVKRVLSTEAEWILTHTAMTSDGILTTKTSGSPLDGIAGTQSVVTLDGILWTQRSLVVERSMAIAVTERNAPDRGGWIKMADRKQDGGAGSESEIDTCTFKTSMFNLKWELLLESETLTIFKHSKTFNAYYDLTKMYKKSKFNCYFIYCEMPVATIVDVINFRIGSRPIQQRNNFNNFFY